MIKREVENVKVSFHNLVLVLKNVDGFLVPTELDISFFRYKLDIINTLKKHIFFYSWIKR